MSYSANNNKKKSVIQNIRCKWARRIYLTTCLIPLNEADFFFYCNISYWVWKQVILSSMNNQNVLEKHLLSWLFLFHYVSIKSEKYFRTKKEREREHFRTGNCQIKLFYKKFIYKMLIISFFNAVKHARICSIIFMRKHTRIQLVLVLFFC